MFKTADKVQRKLNYLLTLLLSINGYFRIN